MKHDPVCEHGTAMDVHCCNCHGGFLFDVDACVCGTDGELKYQYRADGWPLCPLCEEDELYDPLSWERPADALARLKCYACNWDGQVPEKPKVSQSAQEGTPP